jgi:hypothetical protein
VQQFRNLFFPVLRYFRVSFVSHVLLEPSFAIASKTSPRRIVRRVSNNKKLVITLHVLPKCITDLKRRKV